MQGEGVLHDDDDPRAVHHDGLPAPQDAETALKLADLESAAELVHSVLTATPQLCWPLLCERSGCEVWVKHENHTPVGSFKVRGGLVYLSDLKARRREIRGVVAATRGNHGQSVAFAARRLGLLAAIVVPRGNSEGKNAAMQAFGAEVVVHGDDFQEAYEHMPEIANERGWVIVPSFHTELSRGNASYALELFRGVPDLDTVYVPIGLGSGICGVIAARDALGLSTRVVGVVAENAAAYALSFEAGRPLSTPSADTIADGLACRVPDPGALDVILRGADRVVTVSERAIRAAMRHYFTDTHNVAEGAGAAPLAALLKERERMAGRRVALVLTGGNVDLPMFREALTEVEE